jgi:hypothetical protein
LLDYHYLCVLTIANLITFILGILKFPAGMPIVGTCSAGSSAACHLIEEGDNSEKTAQERHTGDFQHQRGLLGGPRFYHVAEDQKFAGEDDIVV